MCLYSPNSIDTPSLMWGTLWAGGIITPANPAYTPDELAFQLKDSGAKAIATQKPFLDNARKAASIVGIPEERIILIGDDKDETYKFKHFTSVRNLAGTSRYRRTKVNADDTLAFLPYSSGTTGKPKGVMLCHRNITSNVLQNMSVEGQNMSWKGGADGKGDKLIAFLPFFHICRWILLVSTNFQSATYHVLTYA